MGAVFPFYFVFFFFLLLTTVFEAVKKPDFVRQDPVGGSFVFLNYLIAVYFFVIVICLTI